MEITSNYHLIPYPDHDYQLKPYVPENAVQRQNLGKASDQGHSWFRQIRADIYTIDIEIPTRKSDYIQNLAYPQFDQVGHLIDIYA